MDLVKFPGRRVLLWAGSVYLPRASVLPLACCGNGQKAIRGCSGETGAGVALGKACWEVRPQDQRAFELWVGAQWHRVGPETQGT